LPLFFKFGICMHLAKEPQPINATFNLRSIGQKLLIIGFKSSLNYRVRLYYKTFSLLYECLKIGFFCTI